MPRRASLDDDVREPLVDESAGNGGINEHLLKGYVAEWEDEAAQIGAIMTEARVKCQPHIDRQKEISSDAAEAGIEKKAFKAKLRERSLKRRADAVTNDLSERQKEIFAEISLKLGDLPLFSQLEERANAA